MSCMTINEGTPAEVEVGMTKRLASSSMTFAHDIDGTAFMAALKKGDDFEFSFEMAMDELALATSYYFVNKNLCGGDVRSWQKSEIDKAQEVNGRIVLTTHGIFPPLPRKRSLRFDGVTDPRIEVEFEASTARLKFRLGYSAETYEHLLSGRGDSTNVAWRLVAEMPFAAFAQVIRYALTASPLMARDDARHQIVEMVRGLVIGEGWAGHGTSRYHMARRASA